MIKIIENEYLKLAFDSEVNNLVELVNKRTGDNYIKKVRQKPVLCLWGINIKDKQKRKLIPFGESEITVLPGDAADSMKISFDGFSCGAERLDVKAVVCIEIENNTKIKWSSEIENNDTSINVTEILFPNISGVFLGESWKDDTFIYPHHAGEKTLNPVEEYTTERYRNFFRAYTIAEDDIYFREINYCGLASMSWMYYYDDKNGFYISSNDERFPVTGLRVETGGAEDPWMGFGFRKYSRIKAGGTWASGSYITAVSCEDWHWGAREYRKWIEPYIKLDNNPSFLKEEFILNQCYNFKKDGGLHNKFDRIPELFDAGRDYHMKHMFIASWNRKGFDCNYPEYYPDMELGTSMDLFESCDYVNKNGGFVTFYINARIFDLASDFYPLIGQDMAIKNEAGEVCRESYGPVSFAVMCPSDVKWRKHLTDAALWMVKSYGATGIYLDQLGSAEPFPCYDGKHSHEDTDGFNRGYLKVLSDLTDKMRKLNPNAFLMIENCGDIYGSYVWGSLTWNDAPYDEHYNVFKYTFSEFVQVNMVNPKVSMPEAEREEAFYDSMERAILLGSVFWLGITYKFNKGDEKLLQFARKAVEFRKEINMFVSNGKYIDDSGISSISSGLKASRWKLEDGGDLVIIGNKAGQSGCHIVTNTQGMPGGVIAGNIEGECFEPVYEYNDNSLKLFVPASRISYIRISY